MMITFELNDQQIVRSISFRLDILAVVRETLRLKTCAHDECRRLHLKSDSIARERRMMEADSVIAPTAIDRQYKVDLDDPKIVNSNLSDFMK